MTIKKLSEYPKFSKGQAGQVYGDYDEVEDGEHYLIPAPVAAAADAVIEFVEPMAKELCRKLDCWQGRTMGECRSAGHKCGPINAIDAYAALEAHDT